MLAHGANIGHGYVKYLIIGDDGTEYPPIIYPALIARASGSVIGALRDTPTFRVGEHTYWVGETALLSSSPITNLTQQRLSDPIFIPILLQHAVQQMPHNGSSEVICVTGLPATWAQDTEKVQALGARLRSATSCYATIKVVPEPLGLVYSLLLDTHGTVTGDQTLAAGKLGIVDMGHHTLDIGVIDRLRPLTDSLDTFQLGSAQPLKKIRSRLSAAFERELSLHETDQAVRQQTLTIAGRPQPLPTHWDRPLIEHGETIAARLAEAWGSGAQLDALLIGGGGAAVEALTAPMQHRFPQARIVPDPQMAVARGFARLARYLATREHPQEQETPQ
jgi:hypothetical protein